MKKLAIVAVCFMLSALACSSAKPSATPTPTVSTSAAPTPSASPCSVAGASTLDATSSSSAASAALTDLRYSDDGCPSIVFEFKDHVPGYSVGYVQGPFSDCGSGKAVATDSWGADHYLQIKLKPASGADTNTGNPTYKGPRDVTVDRTTLKHLTTTCDFEADLTWLAGLSGKHPFKVATFEDPPRLVVKISQTD